MAPNDHPLALILHDHDRLKEVPVETVERLWEIEKERRLIDAQQSYHAAFAAVQAALEPVRKAATNPDTNSHYAKLGHVLSMLVPIITKHGFSRSVSEDPNWPAQAEMIRYVIEVRHRDGHEQKYYMRMPIDTVGRGGTRNKTDLHGLASTMTYVERYLTCKVFGVELAEDNDGNAPRPAPAPPPARQAPSAHTPTDARSTQILNETTEALTRLYNDWKGAAPGPERAEFQQHWRAFVAEIRGQKHADNFLQKWIAKLKEYRETPAPAPIDQALEDEVDRLLKHFQATEHRTAFATEMRALATPDHFQAFIERWTAIKENK